MTNSVNLFVPDFFLGIISI